MTKKHTTARRSPRLTLSLLILFTAGAALSGPARAHGGTYTGPGDVVPPGGYGGGGGGGPGPAVTPGSSVPGGDAGRPTTAAGPRGTPGTAGGSSGRPASITGTALDFGPDLTGWRFWWGFNRFPYLDLKREISRSRVITRSDDFFLGLGERTQGHDSWVPTRQEVRAHVVPALLAALEDERSNDILTACLIALAKIGDTLDEDGSSRLDETISKFLADRNQEVSETAAVSLGILGHEASAPDLFDLLRDTKRGRHLTGRGSVPVRTRAFAAYGLGLLGNRAPDEAVRREIVRGLCRLMDEQGTDFASRDVPVACVTALGIVRLEAPAPDRPDSSPGSSVASQRWTLDEQVAWLLETLDDDAQDPLVQAHVPTALGRLLEGRDGALKERAARRLLQPISKRGKAHRAIQQSCVIALGLLGDSDEDPIDIAIRIALVEVPANVTDLQARNFSMIAAAHAGGRPGQGVGDAFAGASLVRKHLLTHLSRGRSNIEPWAGIGLAVLERSLAAASGHPSADAGRALREALSSARSTERIGAYGIACGIHRDPEATRLLLEKLSSTREPAARGEIAVALGMIDAAGARDTIRDLVRSAKYQPELLRSAAIGLGLLGDAGAVPVLVDMLAEARSLASQAAVASALGFIGDSRSIDPLIEMLRDEEKTALARAFAAAALGLIADDGELPWNSVISVDINYRANTQTLTDHAQGTGIIDIL